MTDERKPTVEPGYYRRDGEDYVVLDPFKLADTGLVETKDDDDARWQEAVAYRLVAPGSNLRIRPARGFLSKFKATTKDKVFARIAAREAEASAAAAKEAGDPAAEESAEPVAE